MCSTTFAEPHCQIGGRAKEGACCEFASRACKARGEEGLRGAIDIDAATKAGLDDAASWQKRGVFLQRRNSIFN